MPEIGKHSAADDAAYPLFAAAEPRSPKILTVAQISQLIKGALQTVFPSVWVSGEISEINYHRTGHIYFSLCDDTAKLKAVVWRSAASRLRFRPEEGQQVICSG